MGNDGILVCNGRDKIVFANQVAAEITEYPRDELVGKGLSTLLGSENRVFLKDMQTNRLQYGQKFCTEMRIVTARGDEKEAEVCIASAKSNGKMMIYVYLRDITEQKAAEVRLPPLASVLSRGNGSNLASKSGSVPVWAC